MTIALVTSASAGSTDGASVTTSGVDTTGATLIVLNVASANTAPTVSDSKGNTWTGLTTRGSGAGGRNSRLYYCANPTVGSGHTFTSSNASSLPSIQVLAFSGTATPPIDLENGTSQGSTNVSTLSTGILTPSENNCVVVAGIGSGPATSSATIDSGFTATVTSGVAGQHCNGGVAYKIQTTAAAVNPAWSWTGTSLCGATIASFKAAASGIAVGVLAALIEDEQL